MMADNVAVSDVKLEKLFCMKGGKGQGSYANNSQPQAIHARSMLSLLKEALDTVHLGSSGRFPFQVADLGCSSGKNTIDTVEVVIKHMIKRYESSRLEVPEFSAFLSDLPSNDYNTLFQLLAPYGESTEGILGPRNYFVAGVPGSFYRRLFPSRSIDFFHSAFSVHWLSQVPESVLDKTSTAYNQGKVFVHGAREATANAYRKQFQRDLATFLKVRSQEMKTGASMFLVCVGRTSVDPTDQGGPGIFFGTHFQDAWDDLVQEGLIAGEKRDSFNIPMYAPNVQDFKEVVEADGSFVINKLQAFRGGSPLVVNHPEDAAEVGRTMVNLCRSVAGVLVDAHIGERLSEELFSRMERRAVNHASELQEQLQLFHTVASLSLA